MSLLVGAMAALGVAIFVTHPATSRRRTCDAQAAAQRMASTVAAGVISQLVLSIPVISVIAALAGWLLPKQLAAGRRARLERQRAEAWPDLLDSLVSALRAGMALSAALAGMHAGAPAVLRPLVVSLARDIEGGMPTLLALDQWRDEAGDAVVDRIALAMAIASTVGGRSLPSVLANLSSFLRAEWRTRGELLARQSWTVNAARLAVAAPWLMVLILGSRAREAYQTWTGASILIAGAVLSAVGYLWMSTIARLPKTARILG